MLDLSFFIFPINPGKLAWRNKFSVELDSEVLMYQAGQTIFRNMGNVLEFFIKIVNNF
jgi:hypothetical protein